MSFVYLEHHLVKLYFWCCLFEISKIYCYYEWLSMDTALQVSWIRKKDYHLLTVGLATYSSDERFSATHLKHQEVSIFCYISITFYFSFALFLVIYSCFLSSTYCHNYFFQSIISYLYYILCNICITQS